MSTVTYSGFMRTPENGSRRSRTLMLDDGTAQVQAKQALITSSDERYLQVRYWTQESGWTHLVIDPSRGGLAGIVAVGHDPDREDASWDLARAAARKDAGIEL